MRFPWSRKEPTPIMLRPELPWPEPPPAPLPAELIDLGPAVTLIKRFEGLMDGDPSTVNLDPYLCPADVWTIGWGHALVDARGHLLTGESNRELAKSMYPNGITRKEAEDMLRIDLPPRARALDALTPIRLTNNERCALISFIFNVGATAYKNSTLRRRLIAGDRAAVPGELAKWIRANGRVLNGLVTRREAEAALFQTP
jgi:lysozyme